MPDHAIMSILHLSDLHFTRRHSVDQKVVVDALIGDLYKLCVGHRRPDLVIFTGDLVQAGGTDSHEEAYDFFFSRISEATGCSDERIFIVPGNHDVAQSVVAATKSELTEWRKKGHDGLADIYKSEDFNSVLQRKFASFQALEAYLSHSLVKYRNSFVTVYALPTLNVDIVVVNTAVLSSGGLKDYPGDEGLLAIPENALLEAIGSFTQNSYRIIATHHPFRMLTESTAKALSSFIQKHGNLHLFGHMHDPLSANITSYKGVLYSDQAGAVYTWRGRQYIGYSLISVDVPTLHYETHIRSYFDERKEFDDAVDILKDGRFYSSPDAQAFWRKVGNPIDENALRVQLSGPCLEALRAEQAQGNSEVINDVFVPTPMKRSSIQGSGEPGSAHTVEIDISFEELVAGDDNIVLYASPEYGRTTVLRELQYRLFRDATAIRFVRVPLVIDFADARVHSTTLLRFIRAHAIATDEIGDIETLLNAGRVCLMFDDVDFSNVKGMKVLREFVTRYPKNRYIFSSPKSSAAPYGAHVVPEMPVQFVFVELCVLRRREMRELVSRHSASTDVENLLDRLQAEFREINLPFTAANGSILMTIYEVQGGFQPINRAVLVEQFIDATLRKANAEQRQRVTFDYANKTALLAHLAAWMAVQNNYAPSTEDVRTAIKKYLEDRGLIAPVDELVGEFHTARVLVRRLDGRVSFRYRAVLEYFIAHQMILEPAFKEWVMHEDRYLQFVNEIQYYAGKLRNDAELVKLIEQRFEFLLEEIAKEMGGEINLHQLASVSLPEKGKQLTSDFLSSQLSLPPLSPEQKDEELEAELPRDVEDRQEVFRPTLRDPGQKLMIGLLLYSGVVKNMELISDSEKRRHLKNVWEGWGVFLLLSLSVATELARHRRLRINGVLYEFNAPMGMSDSELARIIALLMPTGISQVMSASLGTEKLEKQLTDPELEPKDTPLILEFFRASMIADLRFLSTRSALQVAIEKLRSSRYLLEALIWKIAQLRRLDRLRPEHRDPVTDLMASAISDLKGGDRQTRLKEREKQLVRLRRETLVLKVKRQDSEE